MKRIYIELILAIMVFGWTISNMLFIMKGDIVCTFLPIIVSFAIQFLGTIIMAAEEVE